MVCLRCCVWWSGLDSLHTCYTYYKTVTVSSGRLTISDGASRRLLPLRKMFCRHQDYSGATTGNCSLIMYAYTHTRMTHITHIAYLTHTVRIAHVLDSQVYIYTLMHVEAVIWTRRASAVHPTHSIHTKHAQVEQINHSLKPVRAT